MRIDEFGPSPLDTGRYRLAVAPQDGDTVHFSEQGPPDPARSAVLSGRSLDTAATAVWFLAVDSTGKAKTGPATEWRAPVRLEHQLASTPSGYRLNVKAAPRGAVVRAGYDGDDLMTAEPIGAETMVSPNARSLRLVAGLEGAWSEVQTVSLGAAASSVAEGPGGRFTPPPPVVLRDDAPMRLQTRWASSGTAQAFAVLDLLRGLPGVRAEGGDVEVRWRSDEGAFVTLRFGPTMPMPAAVLDALLK